MKAAACQSPSCIKKIKYSKKRFSICRTEFLHPAMWHDQSWHWFHQVTAQCNVACGSGIMTLNSPGGSTLQCGRWLCDEWAIEFAQMSAILEFYIWFRFLHITAVDTSGGRGLSDHADSPPGYVLVHVQADISWLWAFNTWIWNRTTRELKNAWSISSSSFRKMTGSNTTKQLAS